MLTYPLHMRFKLLSIGTRLRVFDAAQKLALYVRPKMFRLKEDVDVWRDEAQTQRAYRLQADRVLDFSAMYRITGPQGEPLGAVRRRGARSIWRAHYEVLDAQGQPVGEIREEDPWLKVADSLVGGIPFVSMLINPAYVATFRGQPTLRVKKEPAFFEGKFSLTPLAPVTQEAEDLLVPSLLMMTLLERVRG